MSVVSPSGFAGAIVVASMLMPAVAHAQGSAAVEFEPRTFTYSSVNTPNTASNRAILSLFEAVEQRTGGAVTFETFWQGSLCTPLDILECVANGQVDIGYGSAVFNPADLPLTLIGSIPFQVPARHGQAAMNALNAIFKENEAIRAEWDRINVHPLYFTHGAAPLLATTRPIETLEDVRGMSIRTVGYVVQPMAAIGANIVAAAPAEQYEALQRGVLHGVIYPTDGIVDLRLYEVADHVYDLGEYMGNYAMMYEVINKDTWDSMQPELQAIFTEEAERVTSTYHERFMQPAEASGCETLASEVSVVGRFGDEESSTRWAEEMRESIMNEWVATATAAGFADAEALRDDYLERLAAFEDAGGELRSGGELCIEAAANR